MTRKDKAKEISLWAISVFGTTVFTLAGVATLIGLLNEQFINWGYSPSLAVIIGALEIVGAIALLLPRTAGWSALGLMVIMVGAITTHVINDQYLAVIAPSVMFVLLGVVVWGRKLVQEPTTAGHVVRTEHPSPTSAG
jgi:putative oxidoreductase